MERTKEEILKEITESQEKLKEIIANSEKEVNGLKKEVVKKEVILEELNKIKEEKESN